MDLLNELYVAKMGHLPHKVERLSGAGSNRQYYRMTGKDGRSLIGVVGTSREENHAFIWLSHHFISAGLPMPMVVAVSEDEMRYLQDDLGDTSLFDAISNGRLHGGDYSETEQRLIRKAVMMLPHIQIEGARNMEWSVCYPQPSFDRQNVFFDLNYFKYCFLKPSGVDFHEMRLEEDFNRFAGSLTRYESDAFMYRDFQARNVMCSPDGDNLHFIDFQGGRRGPYYYDLASFLWQSSAHYSDALRSEMIRVYYDELQTLTEVPPYQVFLGHLQEFVMFRTLQVLGAYGYRGYFEQKQHFLQSIPSALQNLQQLISQGACHDYPYMEQVLADLIRLQPQEAVTADHLVVRVFSFSYKKGVPKDESGNGGGYVFDCRGTHNPGRYEEYKHLTGLDEPVIKFLEDDGEINVFLEHVCQLADKHVERYLERGFTSLMFSFGCTGGQHRSVYSAQHLATHLHEKYGVEVVLEHREQGIRQIFERIG